MPVFPTPVAHCGNRPGETVLGRDLPNHGLAVPRSSPHVGQAEEVEAGPIRCGMAGAPFPWWAEVDDACLVGMEREPKPSKTLAHHGQDALGVDDVVERHKRVVGEPDKGAIPFETWPYFVLEPFVQHVMQEDVRETR